MTEPGEVKGSPLRLPPDDLEALAALLEALVPTYWSGTPTDWQAGWRGCCRAVREVARVNREGLP